MLAWMNFITWAAIFLVCEQRVVTSRLVLVHCNVWSFAPPLFCRWFFSVLRLIQHLGDADLRAYPGRLPQNVINLRHSFHCSLESVARAWVCTNDGFFVNVALLALLIIYLEDSCHVLTVVFNNSRSIMLVRTGCLFSLGARLIFIFWLVLLQVLLRMLPAWRWG